MEPLCGTCRARGAGPCNLSRDLRAMKLKLDYPARIAILCALTGLVLLGVAAGSTIQTRR
jgi:hypothetical protein